MASEIRTLIRELKRKGLTVKQGRKHYRATHPSGKYVSFSVSPSCRFAVKHIMADIKRIERSIESGGAYKFGTN
jgi:hypothetical protein